MSDEIKLGQLLRVGETYQKDAVHIAVLPVVAAEELKPGQHIGFVYTGNKEKVGNALKKIGIVDPYLKQNVKFGQRFYMHMYPGTITSLRHDWTHPDVSDPENESIEWLKKHADDIGVSYDVLMNAAEHWLQYSDYHTLPYDTPDAVYDGNEEFWKHYEFVTNKKIEERNKGTFFSCSC